MPARVLNLVAIVDREWRGEVLNRLEKVGRFHPSRTILCAVERGPHHDRRPGHADDRGRRRRTAELALARERVVLDIGPEHLRALDSIVDPLVVSDVATLVWSPHGHREGVDALLKLSQVVLVDSVNEPDPAAALERAHELSDSVYVVDLAWLRSTPVARARGGDLRPAGLARRAAAASAPCTCATIRTRPPPGCCCSAGSPRGWAGSPAR